MPVPNLYRPNELLEIRIAQHASRIHNVHTIKLVIMVIIIALISMFSKLYAQGEPSNQADKYNTVLPAGFNIIKTFAVKDGGSSMGKVEYSYPFTKDTQYIVNISSADASNEGIIITLYDSNRHKLVSSDGKDRDLSSIIFNCKMTGIYYITYTFENTMKFCGESILGFKK